MKITKTRHIAFNLSGPRVSMTGADGEAWDHLFFIGRAMEKGQENLRAYQIHMLWFNFSYWRTDCKPLAHGLHQST